MGKTRYVAMFETGVKGGNFFRFAWLEYDDGLVPPPIVRIEDAEYVYAPTQAWLAKCFRTSQQNISRWMKNTPPNPKRKDDTE